MDIVLKIVKFLEVLASFHLLLSPLVFLVERLLDCFFFSSTERAERVGPDSGRVLGHDWLWTLRHQLRQQTDVPLHHQQNAELQERRAACHCEFGFITHKSFLQPHHQALPRSKTPSARPADECFLTPQSAQVLLMNNITQYNFIWLNSQNGKRSEIFCFAVILPPKKPVLTMRTWFQKSHLEKQW